MLMARTLESDDGFQIILGLSDGNVNLLKQNKPIVFCLKDLGMPEQTVCISWRNGSGNAAVPHGFDGILLTFSDNALLHMEMGNLCELKYPQKRLRFLLFRGKTELEMAEEMRRSGLIGVSTKTKTTGFAPSDIPPSPN